LENAAAVDVRFSQDELGSIEKVFPKDAVAGMRYPETMMEFVNA